MSKAQLKDIIKKEFSSDADFSKMGTDYLNKWVGRVLRDMNFSDRKTSIAQKIPDNWRETALKGAERIRKHFKSHGVKRIFSADETNVKFHELSSTVLAPIGVKRVGSAAKVSSSDGCTVMVTMDMTSSQLTPPLVIYKGTFGGTLMKKWENFDRGLVLFTEKHWMTSCACILYLQHLRRLSAGHDKIGLIVDKASMHTSSDVIAWIEETNLTEKPQIIYDFVEAGMTSIYSPPDVVVNKPFKDALKKKYGKYRNELSSNFVPGAPIVMSREKVTDLILEAYGNINDSNMKNMHIRRGFDMCGLNPYADDESVEENFVAHLDSLSTTSAYKSLLDKNKAVDLNAP